MSIISVFSGTFCRAEQVIHRLASETGFPIISDKEIVERASQSSGLAGQKVSKAFSSKTSVFNKFTHEKERSIAHLRLAVAERLVEDNLLLFGFIHHLISQPITHVLRVCLIADMRSRVETASTENGLNEKEALKILHAQDEDRAAWVKSLRHTKDPWDPTLYDIVLPTDKKRPVTVGRAHLGKPPKGGGKDHRHVPEGRSGLSPGCKGRGGPGR